MLKPKRATGAVTEMASSQGRAIFAQRLHAQTGLSSRVIIAWATIEGGPDDNPLNIGPHNHYGSPQAAADATARLLKFGTARSRYGGYQEILANKGGDVSVLYSIAKSPWDVGTTKSMADVARYYKAIGATYARLYGGSPPGKPDTGVGAFIGSEIHGDAGANLGAGYQHIAQATGIDAIVGFIGKLFERATWFRVFEVIGGVILLVIALRILSSEMGLNVPIPKGVPRR